MHNERIGVNLIGKVLTAVAADSEHTHGILDQGKKRKHTIEYFSS